MEQGTSEVTVRHLETVVESPQGRDKGITDAWEPAARRCVRLEHQERLSPCLRLQRRVEIVRHQAKTRVMTEILRQQRKGILRLVVRIREYDCAVVAGVTVETIKRLTL